MKMCDEMRKLRQKLTERSIEWTDESSLNSDADIEKKRRVLPDIPESYLDTSMFRTRFIFKGKNWSVINGYGSYGGYDPFKSENEGLLELMIDENDPTGWLTAEQVIEMIYNLEKM